jgi:hypothetical protein
MTTDTWIASGTGNWNTSADWSTGSVPGQSDDVVIGSNNNPATVTNTTGVRINTLKIAPSDELDFNGAASATFSLADGMPEGNFGTLELDDAVVNIAGGTMNNSGVIILDQGVGQSAIFIAQAGGTVTFNGAGFVELESSSNRPDDIQGNVNVTSNLINDDNDFSGTADIGEYLNITNHGTFETSNGTMQIFGNAYGGTFDNENYLIADDGGTLILGVDGQTSQIDNNAYLELKNSTANTQTLVKIAGTLLLENRQVLGVGSNIAGNIIESDGSAAELILSGGDLYGVGTLGDTHLTLFIEAYTYVYAATGGTMLFFPAATTVVTNGELAAINNSGILDYSPISNQGIVAAMGGGVIQVFANINNINGGLVEIGANSEIILKGGNVSGTIEFTGSSATLGTTVAISASTMIADAETGDAIDFTYLQYASGDQAVFAQHAGTGVLSVLNSGGTTLATVTLAGTYTSANFAVASGSEDEVVVELPRNTRADFFAAGTSDLLFENTGGTYALWETNGSAVTGGGNVGSPGAGWTEMGTGSFNTGTKSDILFQSSAGSYAVWDMSGTTVAGVATFGSPGAGWTFKDVGNFDGTGNGDILFESTTGDYAMWQTNGTAVVGGANLGSPGAGWSFEGTGDFNNDGKSDILFENTAGTYAIWNMNGTSIASVVTLGSPGAGWAFKGVGDFDGDGFADILFENTAGDYAIWQTNGTSVSGGGNVGAPDSSFTFAALGDFNGDGKSDVLFQNTAGTYAAWEMNGTTITTVATFGSPGAGWTLQHSG